jgi:hypothetical protein
VIRARYRRKKPTRYYDRTGKRYYSTADANKMTKRALRAAQAKGAFLFKGKAT